MKRRLYWIVCILLLVLSGWYALEYRQEQQWLREKALQIVGKASGSTPDRQVAALRDYIRRHVRHEGIDLEQRPFLRDSAKETLESGRGYCGEATRAFICLGAQLGIHAQRVLLNGRLQHVVAEVETASGHRYLVDVQDNPEVNALLDSKAWRAEELVLAPGSPFREYSNVNLRRVPVLGQFVQRIRMENTWLTWALENPPLLKALVGGGLALVMLVLFGLDRVLVRVYAFRFGLRRAPAASGVNKACAESREDRAGPVMSNIDVETVTGFGDEWTRFDQSALPDEELLATFALYFKVFPWDSLPEAAVGFDLGCGSGRWARCVAPRAGRLHCIDASKAAVRVARRNLRHAANCEFHVASVDAIPLPDCSMDFGYSLGVLHHVPDTERALRSCVSKLKPGAPFLLYLYYALENRPVWFRAVWKASDALRRAISRLPSGVKFWVTSGIALTVYFPLARLTPVFAALGLNVERIPLSAYRKRSFSTMRTDAFDRFGTRLERRFTAAQISAMMQRAGLEEVVISPSPPYWCAVGVKKPDGPAHQGHIGLNESVDTHVRNRGHH